MSVSATYDLKLAVKETLTVGVPAGQTPVVNHAFSDSGTLNSGTTPAATLQFAEQFALTSGAYTLDLTNVAGTNGATVNGNTLKVRLFKVKNTGSNSMTFVTGGTNGYALRGASWKVVLNPGDVEFMYCTASPTIGSSAKTIDVTGTGADTFNLHCVMG